MFSILPTPEKFEIVGFTRKTIQMFSVSLWKRMKCFPSTLRRRNLKPGEFETVGFTLKTHQMFSVHTEFEIVGSALKTHQMFSVHTTPEKFKNETDNYHSCETYVRGDLRGKSLFTTHFVYIVYMYIFLRSFPSIALRIPTAHNFTRH